MNITPAKLRRLIPASAVALVLAVSYMAPLPTQASSTNNCGRFGYGYHDHGKVCPNRPFPGNGKGLTVETEITTTQSVGHTESKVVTVSVADDSTQSVDNGDTQSAGKGHGKGHGNGHGNGHGKS